MAVRSVPALLGTMLTSSFLAASPAESTSCPAGFSCYTDGLSFAKAVGDSRNGAGPSAPASAKLALLCPPQTPCTIKGTQLGFIDGVAATVLMENVVLGPNDADGEDGAVLNIGTGSVTGTGLLIHGGWGRHRFFISRFLTLFFPQPHTRCVTNSAWCPVSLEAAWCMPSDVVPDCDLRQNSVFGVCHSLTHARTHVTHARTRVTTRTHARTPALPHALTLSLARARALSLLHSLAHRQNSEFGGCVNNQQGTFSCTDCVFENCACQTDNDGRGGGVFSGGQNLTLVRTQFKQNSCVDEGDAHGAGCWCEGTKRQCGGCTCDSTGDGAFFCDNGPSSPPLPPPPPPGPPVTCANLAGDWHFGDRYRAQIKQVGCALTLTAADLGPCVRQLRHRFLAHFSAPHHPTHRVLYSTSCLH